MLVKGATVDYTAFHAYSDGMAMGKMNFPFQW